MRSSTFGFVAIWFIFNAFAWGITDVKFAALFVRTIASFYFRATRIDYFRRQAQNASENAQKEMRWKRPLLLFIVNVFFLFAIVSIALHGKL